MQQKTKEHERMKIMVLESSARKKGNTDLLADEFIRGAQAAGHNVEKEYIGNRNIKGCSGCNGCRKNMGVCVQKDDMVGLYPKLLEADIIVMASPVYFYNVNAQMKVVMDRTYAIEPMWKDKQFWLISTGAGPEIKYMETMIRNFKEYISCFEGATFGGLIDGHGTMEKGDVKGSEVMKSAYDKGLAVQL